MEKLQTSQIIQTTSSEVYLNEIPPFYQKADDTKFDDSLCNNINHQARTKFLDQLSKESLDNEKELQSLWAILEKFVPQLLSNCRDHRLDYVEFKQIANHLPAESKLREYFTASTFARLLQNDPWGRIPMITFFNYVMRKTWMQQARVALARRDTSGRGFLRENELESYIKELIPTLCRLNQMDKSYHPFYTCVAVRKFFFFLDPHKHNKIKIVDILCSGFLDELRELRNEQLERCREESNWFAATNTIRLYNLYLSLDVDHNGMLSKTEFLKYGNFTEVFVERLFDVCMTYNREIDFKTFIDIVLALENRKEIPSINFFFSILDIGNKKFLDEFVLRYFFKAIQKQMQAQGQQPIAFEDFSNEIFDMVRPTTVKRIYIEDLLASGYADTIISILVDFNGFYAYENRESNIKAKDMSNS